MRSTIALDSLTPNNVGTFRKINEVCLAVAYDEKWYKQALENGNLVQLAYYSELPVGAVKAHLVEKEKTPQKFTPLSVLDKLPNAVYIELLAVLAAYRNLGIGLKLLEWVESAAKERFIHEILLHVQKDAETVGWYEKAGYTPTETVEGYYEGHLENPAALLMKKTI